MGAKVKQKEQSPYGLKAPCPDCPFRSDVKPYLKADRVREIRRSLVQGEFACHKTTEHDGDGQHIPSTGEVHCAGALILMEKEGRSSQMTRIAARLGMYDPARLDMDSPVYGSFEEMIRAQPDYEEDEPKGEYCHVVDAQCEAPAGYMSGGGVVDGEEYAELECHECGQPVCGSCSELVAKGGDDVVVCNDCLDEEE